MLLITFAQSETSGDTGHCLPVNNFGRQELPGSSVARICVPNMRPAQYRIVGYRGPGASNSVGGPLQW